MNTFICDTCGQVKTNESQHTTGYGLDKDGHKICYDCCAKQDELDTQKTGKVTLYLSMNKVDSTGMMHHEGKPCIIVKTGNAFVKYLAHVSNWPSSLKINVMYAKIGRHNIAGKRYDIWFKHLGANWHGVTYGDNTQICHCKRLKV